MLLVNKNILYLLGSGRSGTTLLSTVLNSTPDINSYGELHQFYMHLYEGLNCSCGRKLDSCAFWNESLLHFELAKEELESYFVLQNREELHKNIPLLLFGKKGSVGYFSSQEKLFNSINIPEKSWILDSSKYVARFLLLKQMNKLNTRGIYVVRDIRGVIYSFSKKVQTTKNPISTILYYVFTNLFAQIVCWLNKDVIKLRYEDLVDSPSHEVKKIYASLQISNRIKLDLDETFKMPHIIGGNRLKHSQSIKIKNDDEWKQKMPRFNQIIYYIFCLPFMLINRYKI